jgi:Ser/Thr protein kinase RdoA (MazF antagonist)
MNTSACAESEHDFAQLQPDTIIEAVETLGLDCDARIFPLNSYENRVYQIGIEDAVPVIGKFYRPNRWSNAQILEEHVFTEQLAQLDIPVIAPLKFNGNSLLQHNQYRYALYPRHGGRPPELDNKDHLQWLGRFLGRIHAAGATEAFQFRPSISVSSYAIESSQFLLNNHFIDDYLLEAYQSLTDDIIQLLKQRFDAIDFAPIRLHGDCHPSNILWTDNGPHFVDFDDSRMGPAIQDLWMLLSGDFAEQNEQLNHILDGYFEFQEFNLAEARLVEPLRTLRIMHYASWLARRWQDPTFPINFPWFNTPNYWEQHILELREQLFLLQENAAFQL